MKDYYFRYVVSDHYAHECIRFRTAKGLAKKLGEKIYLTSFSKSNTYNEPYDEEIITSLTEVPALKKKMITSFYKITGTQPMTRKDYIIAYKFLKTRATVQGELAPFRGTIHLPEAQQNRIYKFLRYNHQVKFI